MREHSKKILSTIFFILILILPVSSNAIVTKVIEQRESLQTGLPDLTCNIKVGKKPWEDRYYINYSIINIGDAAARNFSVEFKLYPIGGIKLEEMLRDISKISPISAEVFALILAAYIHILPFWLRGGKTILQELKPHETENIIDCCLSSHEIEEYINTRICLIPMCIIDKENKIKESNEDNNIETQYWWFPIHNI